MKSSTLFMFSCLLMFCVLNHVKQVRSGVSSTKAKKVCTKSQVFEKNCGLDGNKTCIKGFNKIKQYPFHCDCDLYIPTESKRLCTCKFPTTPC
ncbi:hypothetical protein CARUB_v10015145mg [Capsella rubella]|uniref:Uncharacterized protein n=1 Tax=Capsella rubella TaxID=81985 RepID=R0I1Z1_9BRAS|nr:defensin-like protein 229 [Capsella rubella]EOA31915.1 hypothetical protein CARUB_v10015145mg [Capsella rubella]